MGGGGKKKGVRNNQRSTHTPIKASASWGSGVRGTRKWYPPAADIYEKKVEGAGVSMGLPHEGTIYF